MFTKRSARGGLVLPTRAGTWQSVDTRPRPALRQLMYVVGACAVVALLFLFTTRTLSPPVPADTGRIAGGGGAGLVVQVDAPSKPSRSDFVVAPPVVKVEPVVVPIVSPAADPTASPDGNDPLLFIVISATRPNGTDYATPLMRSIFSAFAASPAAAESKLRVLLYDADLPSARRPDSWFAGLPAGVEVHRASEDALADLASVNSDPLRDKHHDPAPRIMWRTKGAKDLHCVLELAHAQSALGWPNAIVFQDDVQLSSTFFARVRSLLAMPNTPRWLAFALFHAATFDHGKEYADGAPYDYEACGQATMYQTAEMAGFIDYVAHNWRNDPDDWQLRDYQRKAHALVRVAQPSIVQHIGRVSSLGLKASQGGGIASGCWARDFVE